MTENLKPVAKTLVIVCSKTTAYFLNVYLHGRSWNYTLMKYQIITKIICPYIGQDMNK